MKKIILVLSIAALGALPAAADEIQLTNGRKITGKVSKKDAKQVVVEVGGGTITLDAKDVSAVNPGRTPIDEYADKYAAVKDSKKASDHIDLAKWAEDHKLTRYVPELARKVIELDPENEWARGRLHHEKIGGKWMTFEEAQMARGLVLNGDGRWVTKAELELIEKRRLEAKERAMAAAAERERRREEERAARQAAIDDYNARLAEAMSQMDGYFYSPSFAWTTPFFRPYPWATYARSRAYYQRGWMYANYGGLPTLPLWGPPPVFTK